MEPRAQTEPSGLLPVRGTGYWGHARRYAIAAVVGLLWIAAAGKSAQLIREPMLPDRWFWMALVEAEVLLGLLLLWWGKHRWAWRVGAGVFLLFAVVTGVKVLRGEADCGCFGVLPIDPWAMFVVDVTVFGVLVGLTPKSWRRSARHHPVNTALYRKVVTLCVLLAMAGLPIAFATQRTAVSLSSSELHHPGAHVVLTPSDWLGEPFPLTAYLPEDTGLTRGRWEVILARPGCPHCMEYLSRCDTSVGPGQAAVISLGTPSEGTMEAPPGWARYVLDRDRRWYAEVPVQLTLQDGVVVGVRQRDHERAVSHPAESAAALHAGDTWPDDAIGFDPDGLANLGYIPPGSTHTLAYRLRAPVDRPLTIEHILSECRCTTVVRAPARIRAGETGVVVMRLVAGDKPLHYRQGVLIRTNHPTPSLAELRLVVSARIGLPLTSGPTELVVSDDAAHTATGSQQAIIRNDGDRPVRLIYAMADQRGISAQVPREAIPPGGSAAVTICVDESVWEGRPTRLRIPTDLDDQPELWVTVVGP